MEERARGTVILFERGYRALAFDDVVEIHVPLGGMCISREDAVAFARMINPGAACVAVFSADALVSFYHPIIRPEDAGAFARHRLACAGREAIAPCFLCGEMACTECVDRHMRAHEHPN